MNESMNESVLDLITPRLTEQLSEIYEQSGEYQELTEKENGLLERLNNVLTKEQTEMLNRYMTAVNATYAACEKIVPLFLLLLSPNKRAVQNRAVIYTYKSPITQSTTAHIPTSTSRQGNRMTT